MTGDDEITQLSLHDKLCDLDHHIFETMGTETRRKLLRLISCEHNYGNQLAKILNVSNPTVHRHLKNLIDDNLLKEIERKSESYSGHKGGEVVVYKIKKSMNLFLSVMPNLVHAHVIELDANGDPVGNKSPNSINYIPNDKSKDENVVLFEELAYESRELNSEILELEKELTQKLLQKNQVMKRLDRLLRESKLNFRQRIILRALACLGPGCYDDIADILNADQYMINHFLENLEDLGWIISGVE